MSSPIAPLRPAPARSFDILACRDFSRAGDTLRDYGPRAGYPRAR